GIDLSRYEALDAPARGDLPAWKTTLQQAYTSAEYLRGREVNLGLLETYGKNAWLISNARLEDELKALEREVEAAKLELEAVEQGRRAMQSNVAGELQGLEETWRKGVGRMVEAQAAAERQHYWAYSSKGRLHRLSALERRRSSDDPIWAEHAHAIELARARMKDGKAHGEASQQILKGNARLRRVISAPFDVTRTASATYIAGQHNLVREKEALLRSINSLRNGIAVSALAEDLELSEELERHAELMRDLSWRRPNPSKTSEYPNTTITPSDRWGKYTIRLVSPPGLGGLACGELWPQFRQQRQVTKEMSIQIYVPVAKDKSTISSPTLHGLASA
ncbi:hypothetical protein KC343_g10007, partial [Hortaea werneckii]